MEHDDLTTGRLLTRREALVLIGAAGLGLLGRGAAAQDQPPLPKGSLPCVARPQQMEGPFFVDTGLNRSDIRSDPATAP